MADLGVSGIQSLKAVEAWLNVINSNLAGTQRTGFKQSKMSFTGGIVNVVRAPTALLTGLQVPEAAMVAGATTIDFSQGAIVSTGVKTNIALQGEGFFVVSNTPDPTAALNPKVYFTRDGEFHYVNLPSGTTNGDADDAYLVNNQGLYLVAVTINGSNQVVHTGAIVIKDRNNWNPEATLNVRVQTAATTIEAADSTTLNNETVSFINPQGLQFSQYGSGTFGNGSNSFGGTTSPVGNASLASALGSSIIQSSLESANSSTTQSIPELSLAQKMFSAVSKVISVHQNNLDTVINLIR